ncbi:hypothetical protein GPECTOR_13g866 [Gonium pectorale]|uniref:CHRD domain-containing protein n=1 Tax=Gonium pectorale TaxID=33097 RepID=A0A150GNI3_GONPE|nr:hypothetical protein GPECTOR_13g866 [Gonium pectorale]|eukprot:KXZ51377.1 hypothetical protein GPECTOR_13g866 [Gonium pectorale]
MTTSGSGTATFILRRPDKGNGTVSVVLKGRMVNITMAHIHVANASARNPIRLGLLPRTLTPTLLDPPVSYRGSFTFTTAIDRFAIAAWGIEDPFLFIALLQQGSLYVNVHTTANPSGEVQGFLECMAPCQWPVCSARPGQRC